jgi:TetR/AcrR family transcriptional repressor of nem operon
MRSEQTTTSETARWTAKGRATRARIVDASAELMYDRGVAGTSTEDVLRAAAVSNSQLYHYFADKDDLVHAVVDHQIQRVLTGQRSLLDGLDSFAALQSWRDAIVAVVAARHGQGGCPMGSLASELADADEPARAALVDGFADWETAIRNGLLAMQACAELRADADPAALALATLAALQGGLLLAQTRREITPLATALDAALGYIHSFAGEAAPRSPSQMT